MLQIDCYKRQIEELRAPPQLQNASITSLCDLTSIFGCKKPNTRVNLADKDPKGLHISSNASAIQIVHI